MKASGTIVCSKNEMKRLIVKSIMLSLLFATLGSVGFAVVFPSLLRCYLVDWTNLQRLDDSLYVSPEITESRRKQLLEDLPKARLRVASLFGESRSQPIILALNDSRTGELYGGKQVKAALSHLTPMGAFVVLCPKGHNVHVIAHEIVHAELLDRVGWWQREVNIPTWFDEGLAMQVDHRPIYGSHAYFQRVRAGLKIPDMADIETPQAFFTDNYWVHYAASKYELARWMEIVGKKGLLEFLEAVKSGEEFHQAYHRVEKEYFDAFF